MEYIKQAFGQFDKFLNEMTTRLSVIFCLSYDISKYLFIAFKVDIISTKNALLSKTLSWHYLFPPKC